jgi:hypothetical protein
MILSRHKKHFVFAIVFITVAIAGLFAYFLPHDIVHDPSDTQIEFISYSGADVAMFDEKKIIEILTEYKFKGSIIDFSPYYDYGKAKIEIDGLDSDKPMHIVIGDHVSVFYYSADKAVYEIIDNDKALKDKILRHLNIEQVIPVE